MTYLTPRTWVTAELVTATLMNAYLRDPLLQLQQRTIVAGFGDVLGDVIATGVKTYMEVPFTCSIVGWTLVADQVGSLVIDVWNDTYAAFPPTVADTIAGSEKPTLSAVQKNQDLVLTTWTTGLNLGDVLAFKVDSAASVRQATLSLRALLA
jgi:hypothetical protein